MSCKLPSANRKRYSVGFQQPYSTAEDSCSGFAHCFTDLQAGIHDAELFPGPPPKYIGLPTASSVFQYPISYLSPRYLATATTVSRGQRVPLVILPCINCTTAIAHISTTIPPDAALRDSAGLLAVDVEKFTSSVNVGNHAVVVGGSVAGLLAARVLSDSFDKVR